LSAVLSADDLLLERHSRAGSFQLHVSSLEIAAGEVLAVLGRNGAGKSTLLRALAGLEPPARGRIEKHGDVRVTMVFQRPIPFAGTVEHNVRVALQAAGLPREEIERRTTDALDHFGMSSLRARRASRLSGGELRRLALARAFALEPGVLLLDEPFDDLDVSAQESLSTDLLQAVAKTGVAVVVVTHDLRRAVLLCDRIAALQDGELRQIGDKRSVLAAPIDAGVAQLVGMSNLIPGTLRDGHDIEIDPEHSLPSRGPLSEHSTLSPGAPVWAGVRPEHLKVDIGRGDGELIGKARVVEHVSDGVLSTLVVEWAGVRLRTHLVAGRGVDREVSAGDVVALSVRPEDVHVLPRSDESST
jgi:ABC-type Fe3+/spermidine/putrescine transport system ATPase subunit